MRMKVHDDATKTERQWNQIGKFWNEDAIGVEMWANSYHQNCYIYYDDSQVHDGTPEEIEQFSVSEQEKRKVASQNYRRRKKARQENYQRELEKLVQAEEERMNLEQQRKERNQQWQCQSLRLLEKFSIQQMKQISGDTTSAEIAIDIETTGLDGDDEILELSIVSVSGDVLFASYFRPLYKSDWSDAEDVNGISPESVSSAPLFVEKIAEVRTLLSTAKKVICYNANFVLWYLKKYGVELSGETEVISVMEMFATSYGEYNEYYEDYYYQSLAFCAEYYKYDWGKGHNHESTADCLAILHCWNNMN